MPRPVGTVNRDKNELRALMQDRVHEFTEMRHREEVQALVAQGMPRDEAVRQAQQIIEEYDPVVQMALVAVDKRNRIDVQLRAASEVAQYVRPKLKSVEITTDPEAAETLNARQALSDRLVGLLITAATAKKEAGNPPAPTEGDRTEEDPDA